jgi:ABC-type sugar transport system substrate-binding protein
MTTTKTRRTLAAAVAALSLAGAASAGAAEAHAPQQLTIHYSGDGFFGKVKGAKASCLANRTVTVHKASGKELYSDTTETDGRWDTGNSGPVHGRFYATVDARGACLPLVSKTIEA